MSGTGHWEIDTSHSDVQFTVRHMVVTKARGRFTRWAGAINLNEDDLAKSSVSVSIEAGNAAGWSDGGRVMVMTRIRSSFPG